MFIGRTVERGTRKSVAGIDFVGYGAHFNSYPVPYLTAACAVGMTRDDVDIFIKRLRKTIADHSKKAAKAAAQQAKRQEQKCEAGVLTADEGQTGGASVAS